MNACQRTIIVAVSSILMSASAWAQNALSIRTVQFDHPTLTALGVQLPFSGDANQNASVAIQYRLASTVTPNPNPWVSGLSLWRVHPEFVTQETLSPNFAGSIFHLAPSTSYDVMLTITDPDGITDGTGNALGQTYSEWFAGVSATGAPVAGLTTRAVPGDPQTPTTVSVSTSQELATALSAATPGQIIQLAPGTYTGQWTISVSGTAANPIVIRGANTLASGASFVNGRYSGTYFDNTILDGQNCSGCNVLEVYGSYIHVEWVTFQNATRALRSFNATTGNVYRRIHTRNTDYGFMGANAGNPQADFYIADNILEGRIAWPTMCSFTSCGSSSVDGIGVWGSGHVVAHNQLSGFGDAIANWYVGARANDFYGNDVLWNYDDGIELDASEGNVRFFRNRIMNSWEGVSLQPINGGPAYVFRNIVVNISNEELKIHPEGTNPTSGFLAFNNTFASDSFGHAWNNQSSANCYEFIVENNLFQGPVPLNGNYEVDANCHQTYGSGGTIDHNGYSTDGPFAFYLTGYAPYSSYLPSCTLPSSYGNLLVCNFADLQHYSPFELNGQIVRGPCPLGNGSIFDSCFLPPTDNTTLVDPPPDLSLPTGSSAVGTALVLPNVNDTDSPASGPSLGAVEDGCTALTFGPRAPGVDERTPYTCSGPTAQPSPTATAVASSDNPSFAGDPVTFTATVSAPAGTPTGSVTFDDNSVAIGSAPLDSSGRATFVTSTLSVGSHSMSAVYSGDSTFASSTSAVLVQTVNAPPSPSFALAASPSTATVAQAGTTTYAVTVTPGGGFTGNVTLSVSGLPPKSTSTFQPNPVAIGSTSGSSTLTVTVGKNAARKTFTLTITGTAGSLSASTSVMLQVK